MNASHQHYLDGWRGLAIILLFCGHFVPVPGINLGTVGVNLFFVLSGLLMARLLFVREVPLPQFYRRRISRIVPAFVVYLALVVAWQLAMRQPIVLVDVLSAATFTKNYFMEYNTQMPLGHIWSLSVEEHSYILLSLLAVLARRKVLSASWSVALCLGAISAAGVAYRFLYDGREMGFRMAHSDFAAFGIFASVMMVLFFNNKKLPALNSIVFAVLFTFAVLLHWWSVPLLLRSMGAFAALALALHLLQNGPVQAQRILACYPLRQLGLWSYSLYLWQQPFYMHVHAGRLSAPAGIAFGLLCGVASFYLVEQPSRRYLNQRWGGAAPQVLLAPIR